MDKSNFYDRLESLEKDLALLLEEVKGTRQEAQELIEENQSLTIENFYLREKLENEERKQFEDELIESVEEVEEGKAPSRARQNLSNIFDSGFHICNEYFGQRRKDQESCMFCIDVLYSDRTKSKK